MGSETAIQLWMAGFIFVFAPFHSLDLVLAEIWLSPQDSTTPAALSSAYYFPHTLRKIGRGSDTGQLLFTQWQGNPQHKVRNPDFSVQRKTMALYLEVLIFILFILHSLGLAPKHAGDYSMRKPTEPHNLQKCTPWLWLEIQNVNILSQNLW